ncbi:MAG TPA: hypothetical protein VHX63_12145 [Acidobacteriaceae bacterium]|jgi:hypothetical protein|nr:hypothetical protein [Acidobacteriaceae bacterium]
MILRYIRNAGLSVILILALPLGCRSTKSASQNAATGNGSAAQQNAANAGQAANSNGAPASNETAENATPANNQTSAGNGSSAEIQPSSQTAKPSPAPKPLPVKIPAGTLLRVRLNHSIHVKSAHVGDRFTGTMASAVSANGLDLIPNGTPVDGVITEAHRRGHFRGASILQLRLTGLDLQGHHYRLDTGHYTRSKRGKGRRSALMIGGGSGLGMLVGGLATGGIGLVVGGLAGAGVGSAGAALTGNRDIDIPAESVLSFRLDRAVTMRP